MLMLRVEAVVQAVLLTFGILQISCVTNAPEPSLPSTEAAINEKLIGHWYRPQAYTQGKKRPPVREEIVYRADGTCTYYFTSGTLNPNGEPLQNRDPREGKWSLEGNKLHREWKPNWHFFGAGPPSGEITKLTSKEMWLRLNEFGEYETYFRRPHWEKLPPNNSSPQYQYPW
jgi:hypothetical protein